MAEAAEKLESIGRHIAAEGELNSRHRAQFRVANRNFYAPDWPERLRFFPSLRSFVAGTMPTPLQAVCGRLSPFAARVETRARLLVAYAVSDADATAVPPWRPTIERWCEFASYRMYRSPNDNFSRQPDYSQTR